MKRASTFSGIGCHGVCVDCGSRIFCEEWERPQDGTCVSCHSERQIVAIEIELEAHRAG